MTRFINITLNKNPNRRFNRSVDLGFTADHFRRFNSSTNMNDKTSKFYFFVNFGYNTDDNLY